MSDFTKRLRQIESENNECSILAGNCADAIEIEQKKVAIEIARLRADNEKLRAALKPFADVAENDICDSLTDADIFRPMTREYSRASMLTCGHLRAAAAALKETGDE